MAECESCTARVLSVLRPLQHFAPPLHVLLVKPNGSVPAHSLHMSNISSFRDLLVWQKAMDLAVRTYHMAQRLPRVEQTTLGYQLRKTSLALRAVQHRRGLQSPLHSNVRAASLDSARVRCRTGNAGGGRQARRTDRHAVGRDADYRRAGNWSNVERVGQFAGARFIEKDMSLRPCA